MEKERRNELFIDEGGREAGREGSCEMPGPGGDGIVGRGHASERAGRESHSFVHRKGRRARRAKHELN